MFLIFKDITQNIVTKIQRKIYSQHALTIKIRKYLVKYNNE